MPSFRHLIRTDFERWLDGRPLSARNAWSALFRNQGLQAVLVYRFGRQLLAAKRHPWWWPLLALAAPVYLAAAAMVRAFYGIHLYMSAEIGPAFSVQHFGGVEVANCRLGEGCTVGQQTKVGSRETADGPEVGNGVWIGAHAKVLGPVRVGDGATIAPGGRVTKAIPARAFVVGDPGRVVFRGYDNTRIQPKS
jgi:serine O-acetyltransferase